MQHAKLDMSKSLHRWREGKKKAGRLQTLWLDLGVVGKQSYSVRKQRSWIWSLLQGGKIRRASRAIQSLCQRGIKKWLFPHVHETAGFWTIPRNEGKPRNGGPLDLSLGRHSAQILGTVTSQVSSVMVLCTRPRTVEASFSLGSGNEPITYAHHGGSSLPRQFRTCFMPLTQETPTSSSTVQLLLSSGTSIMTI